VREHVTVALVVGGGVLLLALLLTGPLPPTGIQSVANKHFAAAEDYGSALADYERVSSGCGPRSIPPYSLARSASASRNE
jgi:hypothetical protein